MPDYYNQQSLKQLFEYLMTKVETQNDQSAQIEVMRKEVAELQSKVQLGKQMYDEIKIQRNTIKDLER